MLMHKWKIRGVVLWAALLIAAALFAADDMYSGTYSASTAFTEVNTGKLKQMGDDFSEKQFRELFEGKFTFVISRVGKKYRIKIDEELTTPAQITDRRIQFAAVLDPAVKMIYVGEFAADLMTAGGTMKLQTPMGALANGNWTLSRIGAQPAGTGTGASVDEDAGAEGGSGGDAESADDAADGAGEPSPAGENADGDSALSAGENGEDETDEEITDDMIDEIFGLEDDALEKAVKTRDNVLRDEPFDGVDTTAEADFRKKHPERVAEVEKTLQEFAGRRDDVVAVRDAAQRLKIEKATAEKNAAGDVKAEDEGISYELKKKVVELADKGVDKAMGALDKVVPGAEHLTDMVKNKVSDLVYDRDDKVKQTMEEQSVTREQARAFNDLDQTREIQSNLSPIVSLGKKMAGAAGKLITGALDKIGEAKQKAMSLAGGEEYALFRQTYEKAKGENKNQKQALKEALAAIEARNEENSYKTFVDSSGSFFDSPLKFLGNKILDRESRYPTPKLRGALYVSYLKEDKVY
jgi:hypothetical protein